MATHPTHARTPRMHAPHARTPRAHRTHPTHAQYFWFEILELVKKFLLCACLRFVFPGTATQIVVGIIFVSLYMLVVTWLRPYKHNNDNLFSTLIQVAAASLSSPPTTAHRRGLAV